MSFLTFAAAIGAVAVALFLVGVAFSVAGFIRDFIKLF